MTWKQRDWLIFDVETTGLKPKENHIIEFAAVLMRDGQAVERDSLLINPGYPLPGIITDLTGITDEMLEGKPSIDEAASAILAHMAKADVHVAYNAKFDCDFLKEHVPGFAEAREGRLLIDPLVIVRHPDVGKFWPGSGRHRLANVCERLEITVDGDAHRAAVDCEMTGLLLDKLKQYVPDDDVDAREWMIAWWKSHETEFRRWQAANPQPNK